MSAMILEPRTGNRWLHTHPWLVGTAVCGLIALGFIAADPIQARWHAWRANTAVKRAQDFAKAGDNNNAVLSIQIAMQLTALDPAKLQIAADILEQSGSPDAISFRRQLVEQAPTDQAAREALVRAALHFGNLDVAEEALAGFPPEQRASPNVARAEADFAAAARGPAERETALIALLKEVPQDAQARYELAALQLNRAPTMRAA